MYSMCRIGVGHLVFLLCLANVNVVHGQPDDSAHVYVKYEPRTWVDSLWAYGEVRVLSSDLGLRGTFNMGDTFTIAPGRYVFSFRTGWWTYPLYLDTLIDVVSGTQRIAPHFDGLAKANEDGRSMIASMVDGDTLFVYYREHYCCGGVCCEYSDRMWVVKAKDSWKAFYYPKIKEQNCLSPKAHGKFKEVNISARSMRALQRLDMESRSYAPARTMIKCVMDLHGIIQQSDGYLYQTFKKEFLKGLK